MLKNDKDGKLVMMYMDYTNEIPLPDQALDLYAVQSFVFDLQVMEAAPRRSAFARLTRNLQPQYRGDDPIPEGLAFTSLGPARFFPHALARACWVGIFPHALARACGLGAARSFVR
jgi:hypothetical protein